MDALSVRNRGKRAAPKRKGAEPFNVGPSIGLASTGKPGEFRLNMNQIEAIQQLYTSSPAIAAARSVLRGQLLGGGIVLRRGGEDVTLKPEFQRYLSSKWLGFAGDVLDSFLCWGLCVVAYDEDLDLKRQAQRVATKGSKPEPVMAPMVPPRECIEIAFRQTGKMGYTRQYIVYNTAGPVHVTKVDEDARVFIRQQPDAVGNVISPMATVFEMGAQIQALNELALTAEITLARPRIWTQERLKKDGQQVETQNLFFDSESRQIQTDLDNSENAEQTRSLAMQTQLIQIINRLQQSKTDNPNGFDHIRGSFSGKGVASGSTSHVPPEVAPSVFNIPKNQEVAPSAGMLPQARGDLEQLSRLSIELFGSAFGVPSDLLFSGKFASKSTAQCVPALATPPQHTTRSHRLFPQAVAPQLHGDVAGQGHFGGADGGVPRPVWRGGGRHDARADHGAACGVRRSASVVPGRPLPGGGGGAERAARHRRDEGPDRRRGQAGGQGARSVAPERAKHRRRREDVEGS